MANRQVSIPTKIAYGLGTGLVSVKNNLFHFFFIFYFGNVLGVDQWYIVLATTLALLLDAFSDPIMGQVSDNYRNPKWGRRHKFMLWGILPTAIALVLLFMPPDGLSETALFIWMLVFLLAVRLGLTVFGGPYYSLGAELSSDYNERTNIVSIRELFNTLFNLAVFFFGITVFLPSTEKFENGMMNPDGYGPLVITFAIIGAIGSLIAIIGTRRKIPELNQRAMGERTKWTDTFTQFRKASALKSFRTACLGYGALLVLYGIGSALSLYLGVYLWKLPSEQLAIIGLTPILSIVPAVILASFLSAKLDKKPAAIIFVTIYGLCGLLPYILYLNGSLPPTGSTELFQILCLYNAVGYGGLTGAIVVSNSMLADVADEMELAHGKRQEGVLFAAFTFAQKLTFAAGALFAQLALIAIKFPQQLEPSQVAKEYSDGLAYASIVFAIVFVLFAYIYFARYPLTRAKLADIQTKLRAPAQ